MYCAFERVLVHALYNSVIDRRPRTLVSCHPSNVHRSSPIHSVWIDSPPPARSRSPGRRGPAGRRPATPPARAPSGRPPAGGSPTP
eukprot:8601211-Pyramimonas_sp.AAC.1